ncbi:gluconate 2-dehydrogenase subunit 3 family protein [Cupriavidus respiraculi]|uniref:Gluconate 2-dehydrogenase subunit 3 family protein n=1 Tax=Cupriavidus respiraculi TaxID=195930 RepID=A0ABN7Y3C9_9BURK|nr:gluconate 2-dehydrogenase subunit 3 family protein [Cupriavidus respiraculi]CAG9167883.1 hypothetical protein LMG21510_00887 [Cupriavidus respiraculi]
MTEPFKPMRRILLKAIGTGLPATAAAAGLAADASQGAASGTAARGAPRLASVPQFFNDRERTTIDAIVARLIPADDLGPGAREAGVTEFLDRQLAGAWGSGDNFYRHGPFAAGTPEQGYQLAFTPAECFRFGLARLDEACRQRHGNKGFAQLSAAQQDAMLSALERGEIDTGALPAKVFFQMLLDGTMEGFFSDPIHGGNRDMVAWKLVGFPGAYASFANDIERHNVPYVRPPVSIANAHGMHGGGGHAGHGAAAGGGGGASGTPAGQPAKGGRQ